VVSRLQKFAKLVNANVRITKDRTQCADGDDAAFVDRNGHALAVGFAPKMKMTAALALFDKAGALQDSNQVLAINAWKLVTHAGTGTEMRVTKKGSCSAGMGSPSACMLSM